LKDLILITHIYTERTDLSFLIIRKDVKQSNCSALANLSSCYHFDIWDTDTNKTHKDLIGRDLCSLVSNKTDDVLGVVNESNTIIIVYSLKKEFWTLLDYIDNVRHMLPDLSGSGFADNKLNKNIIGYGCEPIKVYTNEDGWGTYKLEDKLIYFYYDSKDIINIDKLGLFWKITGQRFGEQSLKEYSSLLDLYVYLLPKIMEFKCNEIWVYSLGVIHVFEVNNNILKITTKEKIIRG
jgi:hypothetical protein